LPDLKGIRLSYQPWHGRAGAWLVKLALDRDAAWQIVLSLIAIHVIAWTIILTVAKRDEGPNSDSLEAYGWSRLLLWGYGKHPPMTGWLARIWFEVFPESDWALYALAVTLLGCAALACWLLAIRVVDRRRAFVVTAALLIYPVFNFRGARFNPDLLQVPLFILVVLAFLVAFETRSLASALVLGLVCACAVLTKYWALLAVGAVGLSALLHPDRRAFFRSSTPYVAAAVFIMTITPHLI
jgi:4-amino-4-deoxy-L-arabinose transferase-like glycosyltransferase